MQRLVPAMPLRVSNSLVSAGKIGLLTLAVASLSACGVLGGKSKGPKTPVVGKRVSILSTDKTV